MARAWVNFNGANGSIRASVNTSSVTYNGTGAYTVNFATAMPDANYMVDMSTASDAVSVMFIYVRGSNTAMTSSSVLIQTANGAQSAVDRSYVGIAIFR
jgi:hypothetical protein